MISLVLAGAILLSDAAPAVAAPPVASASAAAPIPPVASAAAANAPVKVAANKGPKVNANGYICRNEVVLGSHIPKSYCYLPRDAENRAFDEQRSIDRIQSQFSKQGNTMLGGGTQQ